MKKPKLLAMTLLFLFGFIGLVQAQPRLTIPESVFDFGKVPQHSQISHIFWLHSTGTDTLKIENVKPG
jgi:hypothetical protein